METAQYIEIVFENVESIVIPIERILHIDFGKLNKINNDPFNREEIYRCEFLDLKIRLDDESDVKYPLYPTDGEEPLGMFKTNPTSNNVKDRHNILGRILEFNDIVDVQLLDENEEVMRDIYVPWGGEYDWKNEFMVTKISEDLLEVLIYT